MWLICPVRPGDNNEELRYALRSWEENLVLDSPLELVTVGHCPSWLDPDLHINGNRFKSMSMAVYDNVRIGSEEAFAHRQEEVVFMNDDFFCLDVVGRVMSVRRNCSLADHIAQQPANSSLWWPRSLRLTASWLAEQGFPHPHSYEVHRPLLASPAGMLKALDLWGPADKEDTVPQWRTIYGVINGVEAHPVKDVKVGFSNPGVGTAWISTSDQSWRRHSTAIRGRFQKPSRWEIG